MQKLDAKTGLVKARHVFFQDLMAELKQQKGALPHAAVNTAMVGHNRLFESLDPRVRQDYETRGRHATARNIAKVKEEKESLHAQQQMSEDRQHEKKFWGDIDTGCTNTVAQCRWSSADLQRIHSMVWKHPMKANDLDVARQAALQSPKAPSKSEQAFLASFFPGGIDSTEAPAWAKIVCHNRLRFRSCVFTSEHSEVAFYFLFAFKSPQFVMCLQMQKEDQLYPIMDDMDISMELDIWTAKLPLDMYEHKFVYGVPKYVDDRHLPFVADGSDIMVIPDVTLMGGSTAVSDSNPVPLDLFQAKFPVVAAKPEASKPEHAPKKKKAEGWAC